MKAYRDEKTGRWFLDGVESESETFSGMIDNLKSHKAFKFARYGDGEINCMTGKLGANCDGHEYFPDLGVALIESVKEEPEYMVGIQPLSVDHLKFHVDVYFGHFNKLYNADVLHSASIDGRLGDFIKALEGRYVILVGAVHLATMFEGVHIVIPERNCWKQYEKVCEQIQFHISGIENAVVLLCASMMSEVIIKRFEDEYHTFIDAGSVFDPYVNVFSRRYHQKLKI
jgi:hypothetical protein